MTESNSTKTGFFGKIGKFFSDLPEKIKDLFRKDESPSGAAAPKKKRHRSSLDAKKARSGWFFVAPFVIGLVFIYASLIYDSIIFSFTDIQILTGGGGYKLIWVGLENYDYALFTDADFLFEMLLPSLKQLVFDIIAIIFFSLFIAVLLNQKMAGKTVFRVIFFVPVVVSAGLIAKIDLTNLIQTTMETSEGIDKGNNSNLGGLVSAMDIGALFANLNIGTGLVEVVTGIVSDIYNIVNRSGVQILIFLAGLQSISPAIYESAQIEGATAWETFWKITFPMISPMILANTVYTVIDTFTSESNEVMTFIKDYGDDNVAAAMSWIYFLVVILALLLVALICSKFVFYKKREIE